jgi:hypothetical protein
MPFLFAAHEGVDLSGSTTEDWSSSAPVRRRRNRSHVVRQLSIAASLPPARSPGRRRLPCAHPSIRARDIHGRGDKTGRDARGERPRPVWVSARGLARNSSRLVPCMLGSLRPPVNEAWQLLLAGRAAFTESWDAAHVCNTVFVVAPLVVLSSPPAATPTHRASAD